MRKGNLFVISGPSGAGKGTLVARLVDRVADVWVSRSATTRRPREGEVSGIHYDFLSREEFMALRDQGGLLEWAEYAGNYYGTPRALVQRKLNEGYQVILEIDVQGAFQIQEKMPEAHLIFIEPPSLAVLEERLRVRGTDTQEVIDSRMKVAEAELRCANRYDIRLVNDDLERVSDELVAYINHCAD